MIPETKYAQTREGTHIAYQVVGGGPIDILVVRGYGFPIDMMWEEPHLVRFLDRLSSFCRHIWFDPRGTGASDRIAPEEGRLSESMVDDMVAVLDAVGSQRAAVIGFQAPQPLLFAATHPARTSALILVDVPVLLRQCEDNPAGLTQEEIEDRISARGMFPLEAMAPSLVKDEIELRKADVGGIAVHIGARVAAAAEAGEVLVSRTVCDLVSGSGIAFQDRGDHVLKGVPGTWKLFAVKS
jgi:pimeloyl-ACP methyl ester carboxylesterase